ncbi:hypothetical protein O3P69_000670 [Scylla paramamosain]|uniref:Uncharacterized protein n=1 Tax=Scylla paramamosain TaxID=85552 RepID=A0AAW0UQJ5_SCYPA
MLRKPDVSSSVVPLLTCSHVKNSTATNQQCHAASRGGLYATAGRCSWGHTPAFATLRNTSSHSGTQMSSIDVKKAVDIISEQFSEAMELMNDARSSIGTIYFSEDMEDVQAQVADTLQSYSSLLAKLNEEQRRSVIQSVGLKMEELKSQMSLLEELAKE